MIEIVLKGTYEECRADAMKLFGSPAGRTEINTETVDLNMLPLPDQMKADIAEACARVEALKTPADAPETPVEETIAEAAETPQNANETQETAPEEEPVQEEPETPAITMVEARARMNDLRQKKGAKAVRLVLDELGYAKFTDVKEEDYPKLMVCCQAMEDSDVTV